jgi:antitoxin (DNA-binding transcriptional repressor) of toxin-antitoxin stability system
LQRYNRDPEGNVPPEDISTPILVSNEIKLLSLQQIKNKQIMIVISTRDFRANQTKFLDMVNKGEDIVLKSREKGSFKIVPIREDDTLMSKEEFFAKIDHSLKQVEEGKVTCQHDNETVEEFTDRLLCTD